MYSGRGLFLSKVGNVKAGFQTMPPPAELKTCTVVREPNGEWYASLVKPQPLQASMTYGKL